MRNVKFFPGVIELLNTLKLQGYRLGIVSSNSEANIRSLLKENQIEDLFDFVTGASTFGKGKAIGKLIKQDTVIGNLSFSGKAKGKGFNYKKYSNGDHETRFLHLVYANVKKEGKTEKSIFPFYHKKTNANG